MSKCEELEYARAYIVSQKYENLYSKAEGLCKGTIFRDLYRPYKKSDKNGKCNNEKCKND